MALSRYRYAGRRTDDFGKSIVSNFSSARQIYYGVINNQIDFQVHILEEGERLDTLSGSAYGDSSYWWIIAAASGVGWGLQIPPGTLLRIPTNLSQVFGVIN